MAAIRLRKTRRTSALTGHCPKSSVNAMRSRPRSTGRAVAIAMRSSGNASGSRSSIPIWAENRSRRSATLRPIGPNTEIGVQPSGRPSIGTTPGDGRKPTTPQIAAGIRNDPPVSEPVQIGSMSHASATAEPPDEPPALSRGSKGFPVAPHTRLRVFAPAPNSGLAENDRARLAYKRDHGRIVCGHVAAVERRAVGRQQPCGLVEVLDASRQAVQWAELLALAGG